MLVDAAWAAGANAWSLASFFLRVRAKAGPACGSCRDGAQACHPGLASADEERELSVGASSATCQEAARSRAQGWAQTGARPERSRACTSVVSSAYFILTMESLRWAATRRPADLRAADHPQCIHCRVRRRISLYVATNIKVATNVKPILKPNCCIFAFIAFLRIASTV
jgi:hypothetical protein